MALPDLNRVARLGILIAFATIVPTIAQTAPSRTTQLKASPSVPWVRNVLSNRGVIIFVHGVTGDERSTWTSGAGFWPDMLTRDPTFDGQNIYVYRCPSPRLNQTLSIDEVAENMRLFLTTDGVLRHSELTFVSHSMGGLVTRAFILKYRTVVPKIRLLYFFATPTTGSPYAILASVFSRNPQFKQLYPMQSDNYLGTLQSDWLAAHLGLKSYCAYETQPLYGQMIVERQSATNLCTEHLDPIDADHIAMVKPADPDSTSYRALKAAFIETAKPAQPTRRRANATSPGEQAVPSGVQLGKPAEAAATIRVRPGAIIAGHYPTGELFEVEPKTGALRLLSARLGNISGLAIRPNGEIVVLDSQLDRNSVSSWV